MVEPQKNVVYSSRFMLNGWNLHNSTVCNNGRYSDFNLW